MFTSPSERRPSTSRLLRLALGLLLILPTPLLGQGRQVVSSQIGVASDEATLRLEFADQGRLEIAFVDGSVQVDGETVGSYRQGGPVEAAWRALLGRAVSLDDGPLAEALRSWEPPAELSGDEAELTRLLDRTLEEALATRTAPEPRESLRVDVSGGDATQGAIVQALLGRTDRLRDLAEALENLELDDVQIRVGEDVTVESGEEIDATLVVIDADVEVAGQVRGNIVVVDGDLRLLEGSRVAGSIRLADARLFRDGGVVEGRVQTIRSGETSATGAVDVEELRGQLERRIRDEIRSELRSEIRESTRSAFRNPLRGFLQGLGGLIENVIGFAILSAIGLGVIYFARENLEVVAETVRAEAGRSAVVGMAGTFLLFPVWILGILALVISIIGIPVAIAWIPLFPLAAGLAAGLGWLAVALVVGDWVAERNIQGLEWIRGANPFYRLVAGIGALMLAFAASNVAHMGGSWLDFLEGLFVTVGTMGMVAAAVVGFGAVILTRAGRRPTSASVPDLDFGTSEWQSEPPGEGAGFTDTRPRDEGTTPGGSGDRPGEDRPSGSDERGTQDASEGPATDPEEEEER